MRRRAMVGGSYRDDDEREGLSISVQVIVGYWVATRAQAALQISLLTAAGVRLRVSHSR